jgi:hypothetical protein
MGELFYCLEEQLRAVCGPVPADDAPAGGIQVQLRHLPNPHHCLGEAEKSFNVFVEG